MNPRYGDAWASIPPCPGERQRAHQPDAEGEAAIEQNQCLPGTVMPSDLAAMLLFLAS